MGIEFTGDNFEGFAVRDSIAGALNGLLIEIDNEYPITEIGYNGGIDVYVGRLENGDYAAGFLTPGHDEERLDCVKLSMSEFFDIFTPFLVDRLERRAGRSLNDFGSTTGERIRSISRVSKAVEKRLSVADAIEGLSDCYAPRVD